AVRVERPLDAGILQTSEAEGDLERHRGGAGVPHEGPEDHRGDIRRGLMIAVYTVAGVVAVLLIALAVSYDRFVRQRNLIRNSWANVDTELRRRYDLIPNLVNTVKGYAAHEKEIFEKVAEARQAAIAQTGPADVQAKAENQLVAG